MQDCYPSWWWILLGNARLKVTEFLPGLLKYEERKMIKFILLCYLDKRIRTCIGRLLLHSDYELDKYHTQVASLIRHKTLFINGIFPTGIYHKVLRQLSFSDYKIGDVDRLNTCTSSRLFVWCGWPTLRLYIPAETEKLKILLNDFWCFWVTPWHSIIITLTNESKHAYTDSFYTAMMNWTNTTLRFFFFLIKTTK